MSLPDGITTITLTGRYAAPDGKPLGGQVSFTPSSPLTDPDGQVVLAETPLATRLDSSGSFSIDLACTDNADLSPDGWQWRAIVQVAGAQASFYFDLPSTLGDTHDISALTPHPGAPAASGSYVSSVNGQTGDVELGDGFGIVPPVGDIGGGSTSAPQVTSTHLSAPLPIGQGGTGASSGPAALSALGGISAVSPAFTGTPTAPTATALTNSTQLATTAYADSAVAVEKSRAQTAEGAALQKTSNLSDVASPSTARTNLGLGTAATQASSAFDTAGAATAAQAASLQKSSNLSDLASAGTARTNLGLGTAATLASSAVAQTASNLSDLANAGTARTNLGLGTAATLASSAVAQLAAANTFTADQYYKSGRPWFDVVAFGADPTGAADSTSAIQAAVNAATGNANPATTIRVATGRVWIPAGTYKVSADILIQSVQGFRLEGAGCENVILKATGTGFTTAVLNIDGSFLGTYTGFTILGDGTEQVTSAMTLQWSAGAARSTSQNTFRKVNIRNLNFVNGVSLAGHNQVDGTTFQDVLVAGQWTSGTGNWQAGFAMGDGTFGNNLNHVFYNSAAGHCANGWYCNASNFTLYGAEISQNGTDFFLAPSRQICIQGVESENSQVFVQGSGGAAAVVVAVRDCYFSSTVVPAGGKWVQTAGIGCAWVFENVICKPHTGLTPVMAFNGGGALETVTLVNVQQSSPPSTGVTVASGGSVIAVNYVQLNSSTAVAALFPLWCLNANALYRQGLASARPTATANGEGWYYATDTSTLSRSDGSTWTTITQSAPQVPDVQFFSGSGTWTRPAGAQTVEVTICGGGGGGGSGRVDAAGTVRCGGGGGGGAALLQRQFAASDLTSTVTVTIGAGGAGGAAVTGTATSGSNGTAGSLSTFGSFCAASGGGSGKGGTATTGSGGTGASGTANGGNGGAADTSGGTGGNATTSAGPSGGAAGGGISSANAASNGGIAGLTIMGSTSNTASGGVVDTTPPGTGASPSVKGTPGCGGGGGAASVTASAQAGATPAGYGGGGGGGGAALNGNSSGAGGTGGGGFALVVTYFQ